MPATMEFFASTVPSTDVLSCTKRPLYSRRVSGIWSAPQFVNDAANDSAADWAAKIAVTASGELRVVWGSDLDPGSTGGDRDLFSSHRSGSTWSKAELLFASGQSDSAYDSVPEIAFDASDTLHVVWQAGDDLLYAAVPAGTMLPADPPVLVVNATAFGPLGGVRTASRPIFGPRGEVHFLWSAADILHASTLIPLRIFADGFESGDTTVWQ